MSSFVIKSYSPELYASLCSSVEEVSEKFEQSDGLSALDAISAIVKKHGLSQLWGIQLIHNHFDLENHERLVNIGAVSVPLKVDSIAPEKKDQIKPVSWILTTTGATPYEYALLPGGEGPNEHINGVFFEELAATLHQLNLSHLVGPVYLPGTALGSEYTEGQANITIPPGLYTEEPDDYVEVLWTFQEIVDAAGTCRKKCVKKKTGHRKVHQGINSEKIVVRKA